MNYRSTVTSTTRRSIAAALRFGTLSVILLAPTLDAWATKGRETGSQRTNWGEYLSARHAHYERDYSRAANYYLSVLKIDPENPILLRRAFTLLINSGRVEEAFPIARRSIEASKEGVELARLALAVEAAKSKQYTVALGLLEPLQETGLNLFALPMIRAWLLVGTGDTEGALGQLSKNTNNQGVAVLYGAHIGLVNDLAGRSMEAEKRYRAAVTQRQQPNLRLTQLFGNYYERIGQRDKARALYDKYMATRSVSILLNDAYERLKTGAAPKSIIASANDGLAEAAFSLANSLRQQDTLGAGLFARLALHLKPDFPIARILVAEMLEGNERQEEAIAVYDSIDRKSNYAWTAQLRVASLLDQLDRTDEAARRLRNMARKHTDRIDALINLGDIMRRRERYRDAARAYNEAKSRLPEIKRQHWTLLYAAGIAHERIKQWPKAEADFLKALELEPDQPFVLNYLGYSWVEIGKNLDRARKMIEKAVERRPRDGYIVDSLGWVLYRLGDKEGAIKYMERAVELRPEDPIINDHLGDVYWWVKRHTEARFQWQRALSLEPEKEEIPKIKKKLRSGLPPGARIKVK